MGGVMGGAMGRAGTAAEGVAAAGAGNGGGGISTIDARLRIAAALILAIVIVALRGWPALIAALGLAAALTAVFRCPWRTTLRRLLAIDSILVLVVLTLPFSEPGVPLFSAGPLTASREGAERALAILLKANAVALVMFALIGTLDVVGLGRGLAGLRLPPPLVHLLLLVARYVEVIGQERRRLRQAMTARAFRPRSDGRSWQAFGWLVGMLLVRAFARAERVSGAMRCRGFRGQLDFAGEAAGLTRGDGLFAAALVIAALSLIGLAGL
jgi:cobalt/nickel transport system permease protein